MNLFSQWRLIRRDRVLRLAVIGNTFFWFLATLLFLNLFTHGRFALLCDKPHLSYLMAGLSIGIGLGSVAAGYLSGGKIEYGLVPLGLVGLTMFSALLARPELGFRRCVLAPGGACGFSPAFLHVPVNAIMQHRPAPGGQGRHPRRRQPDFQRRQSAWRQAFITCLRLWPHDTRMIFLIGAAMTCSALIYSVMLLPDALLRFRALVRDAFALPHPRRRPRQHPGQGRRAVRLQPRFVGGRAAAHRLDRPANPLPDVQGHLRKAAGSSWGARILGVIPISSEQHPRELIQSLQTASDAIRNGEVVCIFAEGQITRIGQLLPFRRGMERIMKDVDAPIVPVALDGVLGSISSYEHHRFVWKWPRQIPHPVTVSFGTPLPPTATPFETCGRPCRNCSRPPGSIAATG